MSCPRNDQVDCDITVVAGEADFERELAKGGVDVVISDYSLPRYYQNCFSHLHSMGFRITFREAPFTPRTTVVCRRSKLFARQKTPALS